MKSSLFLFILLLITGISFVAWADDPVSDEVCSTRDRSDAVVILICPPGTSEDALIQAGQSACGTQLQCNAWIWSSAADAPDKAPESDGDLDREKTRHAAAIWVNDSESLVLVSRTQER